MLREHSLRQSSQEPSEESSDVQFRGWSVGLIRVEEIQALKPT